MDFDQIRAFINVASLKSFSAAAEKLFISQPSISVRIKALEEELGVILFDRSKAREPVLTEAGRLFLDYSQSIINLENECREKLSGQLEQFGGLIHVGASTVPGTYLLPFLLADFKKEEKLIDYNIDILDTSAVIEGVLNYSYEIGFVGLIVPHGIRLMVGTDYRAVLPLSAIGGALVLSFADLLSRLGAVELPVGAVTALLGSPLFIYLLYKRQSGI